VPCVRRPASPPRTRSIGLGPAQLRAKVQSSRIAKASRSRVQRIARARTICDGLEFEAANGEAVVRASHGAHEDRGLAFRGRAGRICARDSDRCRRRSDDGPSRPRVRSQPARIGEHRRLGGAPSARELVGGLQIAPTQRRLRACRSTACGVEPHRRGERRMGSKGALAVSTRRQRPRDASPRPGQRCGHQSYLGSTRSRPRSGPRTCSASFQRLCAALAAVARFAEPGDQPELIWSGRRDLNPRHPPWQATLTCGTESLVGSQVSTRIGARNWMRFDATCRTLARWSGILVATRIVGDVHPFGDVRRARYRRVRRREPSVTPVADLHAAAARPSCSRSASSL
jgi:hypothetical protein